MTVPPSFTGRLLVLVENEGWVAGLRDQVRALSLGWELVACDDVAAARRLVERSEVDGVIVDGSAGTRAGAALVELRAGRPGLMCVALEKRPLLPAGATLEFGTVPVLPHGGDARQLKAVFDRAHALSRELDSELVRQAVAKFVAAPSMSPAYAGLAAAAVRPDTSPTELTRIIQSDPEMSFKVLQVVNSAFFGFGRRIGSIGQASRYLGVGLLRALIFSAHAFNAVEESEPRGLSLGRFQRYSIRVARLAQQFVSERTLKDDAFATGIVHDVGKLVLSLSHPEQFEEVLERVGKTFESQVDVERELLGITHSQVGAYLLGTWGFPFHLLEAVAFHHAPSQVPGGARELLAAIHAADTLTGVVYCGEPMERLDTGFLEGLGLVSEIPAWRALVEEQRASQPVRD